MPTFSITLTIDENQMYCAACSTTISNATKNFLNDSKNQCTYTDIITNFNTKTVEILDIEISDHAQITREILTENLISDLRNTGYDCVGKPIITISDMLDTDINTNTITTPPKNTRAKSLLFLPPLVFGSTLMMVEHMGWLPKLYDQKHSVASLAINISIGIVATLLTGWIGKHHFINALRRQGAMDVLISLGCISAILDSFLIIAFPHFFGDKEAATFFSVPLMILGFLKLSHALRDHLQANINAQIDCVTTHKKTLPKKIWICRSESIQDINQYEEDLVSRIPIDSIICVKANDIIPIDGKLQGDNNILVSEAFYGQLGETSKKPNDIIYAGAINTSRQDIYLKTICKSTDNQIQKAYRHIQKYTPKPPAIEWISRYFLRGVIASAVTSALFWGVFGPEPRFSHAMQVFMGALLSACPCGLGLLDLNASMIKSLAFKKGILIQADKTLSFHQATDICVDKDGTLTPGEYILESMVDINKQSPTDYLQILSEVFTLENQIPEKQRSAIAKAIIAAGCLLQCQTQACGEFYDNPVNPGRGGMVEIAGRQVIVGNTALLQHYKITIDQQWHTLATTYANQHKQSIFVAIAGDIKGLLILKPTTELQQTLRLGAKETIQWLITQGKRIHILTGDSQARAAQICDLLNAQITIAHDQTPASKVTYIQQLREQGYIVAMLGDEINDTAALEQANFGLAIDSSVPACEKADAVLNGNLIALAQLIYLAKTYQESYRASLIIAFGVNAVALSLATGVLYPVTHQLLDPMIPGMMMAGSSLLLMLNIAFFQWLGHRRTTTIERELTPRFYPANGSQNNHWTCCLFQLCCSKTSDSTDYELISSIHNTDILLQTKSETFL